MKYFILLIFISTQSIAQPCPKGVECDINKKKECVHVKVYHKWIWGEGIQRRVKEDRGQGFEHLLDECGRKQIFKGEVEIVRHYQIQGFRIMTTIAKRAENGAIRYEFLFKKE